MDINKSLLNDVIAKNIRSLRESKCVTQDQLAKILDVSRPTLINYETGKQSIGIGDIYALAIFFKVQISDLLPSIDEIANLSRPDILLEKDDRLPEESKEKIKEFLEGLRKV